MRGLGLCVLVLGILATPALAGTQVFPLGSSGLPDKLAGAPGKMTKALASALDADVASVPIEDAAGVLECDPETPACLASVAKSLSADKLVFGAITYRVGGKLGVTLTQFDGSVVKKTFELTSGTPDSLASELVKTAGPMFGLAAIEDKPPPVVTPPIDEPKTVPGKVTTGTWAMVGAGAVLAAGGAVMLVSAQSIKRDVQNAPTDTLEDIQRLRALEDRGAQRTLIGNVMLIGGGAALAVGVVRAVLQRRSTTTVEPIVQPVPTEGGAVIVLTVIR